MFNAYGIISTDWIATETVILGYDHILTLPREVTAIWRRPITLNTALYLANRYLATIGSAVFLGVGFLTLSDKVCSTCPGSFLLG